MPSPSSTLMNFFTIEFPAFGVAVGRLGKPFKLVRNTRSIGKSRKLLQVFANQLVQTLPEDLRPFARPCYDFVVDRESEVHAYNNTCARILCQSGPPRYTN